MATWDLVLTAPFTARLRPLLLDFDRQLSQLRDTVEVDARKFLNRRDVSDLLRGATSSADEPAILNELIGLCVRGRLQHLLAAYDIAPPTYNYLERFEENVRKPWAPPATHVLARTPSLWTVLGFEIGFPLGVPASVLTTNCVWIDYYARQGFNVLTYKTVRSEAYDPHPAPNWVFLHDCEEPLVDTDLNKTLTGDPNYWPRNPSAFSMANSFGVPSPEPDQWQGDVEAALQVIRPDQLLIVSVMGFYEKYRDEKLAQDFAKVAMLAEETGAPAIELNLSCPNTIDTERQRVKEEFLCDSPKDTEAVVTSVRDSISDDTRLIIKLSTMSKLKLEKVIVPLARKGLIQGVSGINTIQMRIEAPNGGAIFPPRDSAPREIAGVSGIAIRDFGMAFVQNLAAIRRDCELKFDIIGMGGVMDASDVGAYLEGGATAVQTATAAFFNPGLPQQVYEWFGGMPLPESALAARSRILETLAAGPKTVQDLAADLGESVLPASQALVARTRSILEHLENEGLVVSTRSNGRVVFATGETVATTTSA